MEKGDVILSISGFAIDRRGYFEHPDYGKPLLAPPRARRPRHGIQSPNRGPSERQRVRTIEATLQRSPSPLVPGYLYDEAPPFLIKGGLVFQELSRPYLEAFGKGLGDPRPSQSTRRVEQPGGLRERAGQRVVVLTRVVATEATIGI